MYSAVNDQNIKQGNLELNYQKRPIVHVFAVPKWPYVDYDSEDADDGL